MTHKLADFEDVSLYTIEDSHRETLLANGIECAVNWSTRDGWPVGVMHIYFWREGRFFVTCTAQRKRVSALRREPRSSVIVAFPEEQTITAKTLATVHAPGNEHAAWFYPALAERMLPGQPKTVREAGAAAFVERLESDQRVILELVPQKWITFDGRKVKAHSEGRWQPGMPWIEPSEAR